MHARIASPSTATVHAPQSPLSQPCLDPGRPSPYRNASSSVVFGVTAQVRRSPLPLNRQVVVSMVSNRSLAREATSPAIEPPGLAGVNARRVGFAARSSLDGGAGADYTSSFF